MNNNESTSHGGFPIPFCNVCHQYMDMGTCRCTTGGPPPHPYKTSSPYTPVPIVPVLDNFEYPMPAMDKLQFKWEYTFRKLGDEKKSNIATIGTNSNCIIEMVVSKIPGKSTQWVCFVYTMGGIAHAGGGENEYEARLYAENAAIKLLDGLGLSLPKGY